MAANNHQLWPVRKPTDKSSCYRKSDFSKQRVNQLSVLLKSYRSFWIIRKTVISPVNAYVKPLKAVNWSITAGIVSLKVTVVFCLAMRGRWPVNRALDRTWAIAFSLRNLCLQQLEALLFWTTIHRSCRCASSVLWELQSRKVTSPISVCLWVVVQFSPLF